MKIDLGERVEVAGGVGGEFHGFLGVDEGFVQSLMADGGEPGDVVSAGSAVGKFLGERAMDGIGSLVKRVCFGGKALGFKQGNQVFREVDIAR